MKNRTKKLFALTAAASMLSAAAIAPALSRGGGGGGRGFGGGFDRGFGDDAARFDRGFDDGPRDFGGRTDDSAFQNARPIVDHPPVSESDLRAGADHEYGSSSSFDRATGFNPGATYSHGPLASDGGFGRVAMQATARNEGIPTTSRVSGADLASRAVAVRDGYRYDAFDRNWWDRHPDAWYYPGWGDGWAWGGAGWGDLGGWWGVSNEPVEYDYGNNITYQNNQVYYGSQPTASAETYYDQAQSLAATTPAVAPTPTKATQGDWKPLGVYSLTQGSQTNTTVMFQLAVNKAGTIRGNYYNALTQETKPVHGAVDKKDMRASWFVGSNKTVVYDTGLANLLKPQSTCLVHLSKTQTQQWNLIKLNQPAAKT